MRYLLVFIGCLLFFGSCAQTTSGQTNMYDINQYLDEESKQITKENFVDQIMKQIKHYPKEPVYYLRINKQNCLIEVLVNDVRRHVDYELSNYVTPIKINSSILKSGKQTITVRMYPVGNLINESLGKENEAPITTLLDNSSANSLNSVRSFKSSASKHKGTSLKSISLSFENVCNG